MKYLPIPSDESRDDEVEELQDKEGKFGVLLKQRIALRNTSRWSLAAKAFTIANIGLCALNAVYTLHLWRDSNCITGPSPPWSPIRNDRVIRYVNTEYKPQKIFQSETSPEVEAAWEGWLDENDHLLILPIEETKAHLPITVDAFLDPGNAVYGLAVYHQMHCLNHIRKTFDVDKFFPNMTREKVIFHKNHCFDMLRQSIMCHGDIAIMHWWNDTYSYVDEAGRVQLTDHYHELTPSQRAEGAFAKWDAKVQCRDLEAINAWAKARSMEDDKYAATVGQLRRRASHGRLA